LAALAVSITLPPPTLRCRREPLYPHLIIGQRTQGSGRNHVVLTRQLHLANSPPLVPSQRGRIFQNVNPAAMRATRSPWGHVRRERDATAVNQHAIFIGKRLATLGSVKTATYSINISALSHVNEHRTDFGCLHVLQVHTDLASDAISKTKIRRGNLHRKFVMTPAYKQRGS
jgi:hypothetical protein